jgi:hypothetical protein
MTFVAIDVVVRGEVVPMRFPAAAIMHAREASRRDGMPLMERLDQIAEAMMDAAEWIAAHYTVDIDRETADVRSGQDGFGLFRSRKAAEDTEATAPEPPASMERTADR